MNNFIQFNFERNNFSMIERFPFMVYSLQKLNFESNRIELIEHEAFLHLKGLIDLSISNNSLRNVTKNNFNYLFSLKYLNVSFNKIEFIEMDSFINLIKLVSLS